MKFGWFVIALVTAAPAAAQKPDYEQLAENSLKKDDYVNVRRNLELAMRDASDPDQRLELRRKLAVAYIFDGELNAARKIYEDIIEETTAIKSRPEAHDHYALATIGALQHKKHEVQKHLAAGDAIGPRTPYSPMLHAIAWAHVGDLERVGKAKTEMETTADGLPNDTIARQAAALTRLIYAAKIRAFDVARSELPNLTSPALRAFGNVFLANATRREGRRAEAADIDAEVHKFKELSIYSAIAWRMIKG